MPDSGIAAVGARNIIHYMQNKAMRLMISRGQGLPSAPEIQPLRQRQA